MCELNDEMLIKINGGACGWDIGDWAIATGTLLIGLSFAPVTAGATLAATGLYVVAYLVS